MSFSGNQDELEATCHESGQYREYISGHKDATIDGSMFWDSEDPGQEIVSNAFFSSTKIDVRFRMQEATAAKEILSKGIITSWSPSAPNDDMASIDFTLRLSGDFTLSTQ
jgi:hypothetical protein